MQSNEQYFLRSSLYVIPAEAGIQQTYKKLVFLGLFCQLMCNFCTINTSTSIKVIFLDSRFRRNDIEVVQQGF